MMQTTWSQQGTGSVMVSSMRQYDTSGQSTGKWLINKIDKKYVKLHGTNAHNMELNRLDMGKNAAM